MNGAMRLCLLLVFCSTLFAETGVRILFGVGDREASKWDGGLTVSAPAQVASMEAWRADQGDELLAGHRWKLSVHRIRLFGAAAVRPFVANGVLLQLKGDSAATEVKVETAQGNFTFKLGDLAFGKALVQLNGRVQVDRIPVTAALTNDKEEQDYPAAARAANGDVWVAYLQFKHHPDHDAMRHTPDKFDWLTAKPGGDQILVKRWRNGAWSAPIAVSDAGGDLYRPAVAVDAKGRAWAFWSANDNGNFDLFARAIDGDKPGAVIRLTKTAGTDMDPVATTDSTGRVWVAWQAWRNGRAQIHAAVQKGDGFGAPFPISAQSGNEWNPAIAAAASGRVTIAYDSYRNGHYDIYAKTMEGGKWTPEFPLAATPAYEAYASIAYAGDGTLWASYEEGGERWGKDFGADESSGVAIYAGRAVRLTGIRPDGSRVQTQSDPGTVMPGVPGPVIDIATRQVDNDAWLKPRPDAWKNRGATRATNSGPVPRNTMPRLAADPSGRLWLAFRSMHPTRWSPLGTVYSEHLVSVAGSQWTGSIFVSHSDNILDNRPAMVATGPGALLMIGSADGRFAFRPMSYFPGQRVMMPGDVELTVDPHNNDLWTNAVTLEPGSGPVATKAASAATGAALNNEDRAEQTQVATARAYRMKTKNGTLQLLRGEFHRHSEISMDGGGDGTILDQYRYMIDASYMDWVGCCDHDNGNGREYSWWISQKLTDLFHSAGKFMPMFSYERSVAYPEGHRNAVFAQRGVRPLPRLPRTTDTPVLKAPDTQMFYRYLKQFRGIVASHTSGTNMGTDWRDNDPEAEPAVEIYQGDRQNYEMPGAPRTNTEDDSIGGWRPKGFVNLALEMGYKLAFQASSDHISTHMSYCNLLVKEPTREAIMDAFGKRHLYGATDHIIAEFRSGDYIMGDAFSTATPPQFSVKLQGTGPFKKIHVIKDNKYVYSTEPGTATVNFTWRDTQPVAGKTSYYYVRGEQADGEVVWISPMWITYTGR